MKTQADLMLLLTLALVAVTLSKPTGSASKKGKVSHVEFYYNPEPLSSNLEPQRQAFVVAKSPPAKRYSHEEPPESGSNGENYEEPPESEGNGDGPHSSRVESYFNGGDGPHSSGVQSYYTGHNDGGDNGRSRVESYFNGGESSYSGGGPHGGSYRSYSSDDDQQEHSYGSHDSDVPAPTSYTSRLDIPMGDGVNYSPSRMKTYAKVDHASSPKMVSSPSDEKKGYSVQYHWQGDEDVAGKNVKPDSETN